MNNFKKLMKRFAMRNYKYIGVKVKGIPMFPDRFNRPNKDIVLVGKNEKYVSVIVQKQGDKVIQVHEKFTHGKVKHNGDPEFEVNGVRQGQVYHLTGLGFMGDLEFMRKVILVTNDYVFLRDLEYGGINCSTHDEVKEMKEYGSFSLIPEISLKEQIED